MSQAPSPTLALGVQRPGQQQDIRSHSEWAHHRAAKQDRIMVLVLVLALVPVTKDLGLVPVTKVETLALPAKTSELPSCLNAQYRVPA